MTNREEYAEQILDIACDGSAIALVNGKLTSCLEISCDICDFSAKCECQEEAKKWANSEYVEPTVDWSKVAVDTPIFVRYSKEGEWRPKHFAKYKNGKVYAWIHGKTSWSSGGCTNPWDYAKLAESEVADA